MKRKHEAALGIAKKAVEAAALGRGLAKHERLIYGGERQADGWEYQLSVVSLAGVKGLETDANSPGRLVAWVAVSDDSEEGVLRFPDEAKP